jgi:hypothetical protein
MSTVVGQAAEYPLRATKKERTQLTMRIVFASAGAVSATSDMSDPGLTAVLNGTGTYDCTLPACPGLLQIETGIYSPLLSITGVVVTAKAPTLGTMTFKTLLNDLAAAPASGDEVWLTLTCDKRAGN